MKIEKINLNHSGLFLARLPYGTTCFELKVGYKTIMLDVIKNSDCAWLEFYNKLDKDRNNYSKYGQGSNLITIRVEKNSYINKDFVKNRELIRNAQKICDNYDRILHNWR